MNNIGAITGMFSSLNAQEKQCYAETRSSTARIKLGIAALSGPFIHLALSIANIAYRILRLASFYHLWKKIEQEEREEGGKNQYRFKARLLDAGKDALRVIGQPAGYIALEIVAFVGLVYPFWGMKTYDNIEKALYGRPLISKGLHFVPKKNLEEKLKDAIKKEEKSSLPPSLPRFKENCMAAFAEHIILAYKGEKFDTWFADQRKILKDQVQKQTLYKLQIPEDQEIFEHIAKELMELALKNPKNDPLKKFKEVEQIQAALKDECFRLFGELKLETENLEDFANAYIKLRSLAKNHLNYFETQPDDAIPESSQKEAPDISDKNPVEAPKASISLEEALEEVIKAENEKIGANPNLYRFANNCMQAFAEHIILSYNREEFDTWFADQHKILEDCVREQFNLRLLDVQIIFKHIAQKLNTLKDPESDLLKKFKEVERIQEALKNAPKIEKEEQTEKIETVDAPLDTDNFKRVQRKIVECYVATFAAVFEKIKAGESTPDPVLQRNLTIMQVLIQTIDDDFLEEITEKLSEIPYNPDHLDACISYFNTEADIGIQQAGAALKIADEAVNIDFSAGKLHKYPSFIKKILEKLPAEEEKNFYLDYFQEQVKNRLEIMGAKFMQATGEKKNKVYFTSDKETKLKKDLKKAAKKQDEKLNLGTMYEEPLMEVKYDPLHTRLIVFFPYLNSKNIRDWIDAAEANPDIEIEDLDLFQDWVVLDKHNDVINNVYCGQKPSTIDDLYTIFLDQKQIIYYN